MAAEKLTDFIESISGDSHLRVQDDLGDGYVRLRAAEAQRRQAQQDIRCFEDVVIEMLRNSRDAHATLIFVATWKEADARHLTMIDNGEGVPENLHETIFEAFVTSKLDKFHNDRWGVHGRGMALYSIKQNTDEARVVASAPGLGSAFQIISHPAKLTELRDQSTVPTISQNEEGQLVLKGPHNIIRKTMEFAIDERNSIVVFLGSATEIAATLRDFAERMTSQMDSIFDEDIRTIPLIQRFAFPATPEEFAYRATSLGLPMSDRSARRILDGEIKPLAPILDFLSAADDQQDEHAAEGAHTRPSSGTPRQRHMKIPHNELKPLLEALKKPVENLAEAYYLDGEVEPTIKQSGDTLRITIPLNPKD